MNGLSFSHVVRHFALAIILIAIGGEYYYAYAATSNELKEQIQEKAELLKEIDRQIYETQKELETLGEKGKTLKSTIQSSQYKINQLNLNIKASEINIEKLGLEIENLQYDIDDTQKKLRIQKSAVASLLNQLYQKQHEPALVTLLRSNSLAESFQEIQNISNFNTRLAVEVADLVNLNQQLSEKLTLTENKKQSVEREKQNLANQRIITNNQKSETEQLLAQTKNQEREYQRLLSNLETQQAEIAAEIEKIEEELRLTIDPALLPTPRPGVLAMPVRGRLSQGYGGTSFAKNAYRGQWHNGVDFAAPIGTPIVAAESGTIMEMWNQDKYCYRGAYGKFVAISHGNNLTTLYAHMSLFNNKLSKGDTVQRGDLIGYVGNTGYATGPHLHFTVYASQTFRTGPSKLTCGPIMPYGGDLDPMLYLER